MARCSSPLCYCATVFKGASDCMPVPYSIASIQRAKKRSRDEQGAGDRSTGEAEGKYVLRLGETDLPVHISSVSRQRSKVFVSNQTAPRPYASMYSVS
ncbi:hypothetical protein K402DRAFT_36668 [Aulographum hederae CBS 113979]|uniref:Uncharacterized protein n=1 Tax=Aulographum hederae CBS 113979 TaxID=1176131 RepID=A0A6G1H431_9PEZI|nr:hypothetical protein K402DRAFT_36668 [Aulographum hederae CBS 113979]